MSKCGKCGDEGHNARSCGKEQAPKKPEPRARSRKEKRAAAPSSSVSEALIAKREQLKKELAKVESVLEVIGELGL